MRWNGMCWRCCIKWTIEFLRSYFLRIFIPPHRPTHGTGDDGRWSFWIRSQTKGQDEVNRCSSRTSRERHFWSSMAAVTGDQYSIPNPFLFSVLFLPPEIPRLRKFSKIKPISSLFPECLQFCCRFSVKRTRRKKTTNQWTRTALLTAVNKRPERWAELGFCVQENWGWESLEI